MGPLTSPPAQTPSADGSSDTNENTEQAPPQPSMSDDLMADIDWVSPFVLMLLLRRVFRGKENVADLGIERVGQIVSAECQYGGIESRFVRSLILLGWSMTVTCL